MKVALRPALLATLLASLAASCGDPPPIQDNRVVLGGPREGVDPRILRANPAGVVAAELAFARAAQEKGQWTAFAEYATEDAVMFVPQTVNAQTWLKGRANPAQAVRWQPHQVWSSCDGSLAVTKGAWQRPDGSVGYFTTVWERQQKQKDGYRWVMDQGDVLAEPLAAPEMIDAKVADCGDPPSPVVMSGRTGNVSTEGQSNDGTLFWIVTVKPDGGRDVLVKLWQGGEMANVLHEEVAAGQ